MDDTAILKTCFSYCILHYLVGSMGIYANGIIVL